jgi:hypothetical protein
MMEYINAQAIANSVRMVCGVAKSGIALVEDVSDVDLVNAAIGSDFYLIPALNETNFTETVKILHDDDWLISYTSAQNLIYSGSDLLEAVRDYGFRQAPQFTESKPTLIVLTSSSATSSWQKVLNDLPVIELLTEAQMNKQYQDWSTENTRRVSLIRKKFTKGLTVREQKELTALRSELRRRLNAKHPISFEALDELDEYLVKVKSRTNKR